jgi:SAM-dependent methyltransferase
LNITAHTSSPSERARCPVCDASTKVVYRDLFDDRYGYPDLFVLRKCGNCGHRHVPARFTGEELGQLYTRYYPRKELDVESFEPAREVSGLNAWIHGESGSAFRWVPRGVKVLDIGCGTGQTLAYHESRGCEAIGIEADHNVMAIAARHKLKIVPGVFDGTQFESASFDYVTLDQVAEHVLEPHALMQGVCRVLKRGGTAVVTTPNPDSLGARLYGRHWLNWHIPYHMQFYTRRSMAILAQRAGLVLAEVRTITPSDWLFYQWRHMATLPQRGQKSGVWYPGAPRGRKGVVEKLLDREFHYLPAHRLLSRFLDVLGLGDNRIFFLRKP